MEEGEGARQRDKEEGEEVKDAEKDEDADGGKKSEKAKDFYTYWLLYFSLKSHAYFIMCTEKIALQLNLLFSLKRKGRESRLESRVKSIVLHWMEIEGEEERRKAHKQG